LLFLENPNLLEDISKSALKSLIKRDVVPVSFLQWAANQDDEGILLALTINEQTPKSVLDKLANHSSESVKEAAKLHINWRVELELNWQEMVYEAIPNSSLKRNEEKEGTLAFILPI